MRFSVTLVLVASLILSACSGLKGLKVGNYDLAPVISASEKLANSQEVSEPAEIDIGMHMAATLVGAAPLLQNNEHQRYLNKVGKILSLHSNRVSLPWKFGILNDDDINAFAAPGGYVFITKGMMAQLESEAELAGVLAHEISHVTQKHHLKAVQKDNMTGAAADILGAVTDHQIAKSGGQYTGLKKGAADTIVGASRTLYARGLDRADEMSADNGAITLMTAAGYDPWAYIAVLQKLEARQASDASMALLLKTHPQPTARIKALSQLAVLSKTETDGKNLAERFALNTK